MLAVTNHKITLSLCGPHNDMGNFFPSQWTVMGSEYFWLELYDYVKKKEFEDFDMSPEDNFDKKQVLEGVKEIQEGKTVEYADCIMNPFKSYLFNMQNHIKNAGGSQLWQFNAVNKDKTGWIRQMVALGSTSWAKHSPLHGLREVTFFERKVKIPVLLFVCKILNKTLVYKRKKEILEWKKRRKEFFDSLKEKNATV